MRIGVDLDDVLAECTKQLVAFHNEKYGTRHRVCDIRSSGYRYYGGDKQTALKRFAEFFESAHFDSIQPINEALANISFLQDHELFIVTSRPEYLEKRTRDWVNKHFPQTFTDVCFASHHLSGNSIRKPDICKKLGVNILIEDFVFQAKDCLKENIPVILIDRPWNRGRLVNCQGVKRAKNWPMVIEIVNKQNNVIS